MPAAFLVNNLNPHCVSLTPPTRNILTNKLKILPNNSLALGCLTAIFEPGKALEAIGRNPEATPKIQTAMILAIAFAEAIAIYALVVALIIKFV